MSLDRYLVEKVSQAVLDASSRLPQAHKALYEEAIEAETDPQARWALEMILDNARTAEAGRCPLCDDTGIPHLILDLGDQALVTAGLLDAIEEGVRLGLRTLPGRPMAVKGGSCQRIDQSLGVDSDPGAVEIAPILIRRKPGRGIRLHILMLGGGPAIRAKTYRIFHDHRVDKVEDEIVEWATEATALLGCTPCTLAVGVGRSHFEASSLMLQALADGVHDKQNALEQRITDRVNQARIGPLGLGGKTTVLATFLKVGPQRASGARIVSLRPSCCYEPRIASLDLSPSEGGEDLPCVK